MGTIQRQGIINAIIVYTGVVLGFFNRVIIQPHYLTPEEVGLSGLLISFSGMLMVFFSVGSASMCVRFFPTFRDKASGHHGFMGFLLLFPLTGVLAGGVVLWILKSWIISRYSSTSVLFADYFYWVYPLAVVMSFIAALSAYASSLLKTTVASFLNDVWIRILLISIVFLYVASWISFDQFVAGIFVTYLSQMVLLVLYILRIDGMSFRIDWAFVHQVGLKKILSYSGSLALTVISTLSLRFLDAIMIGAFLSEKAVAVYTIGAFIAQFIETPLNSLERIAVVKIAHAFQLNNLGEIKEIYYKSVRYLFLIGGFIGMCIITCIHDLLKLLPEAYHDAALVTIIASIGSMCNMGTGVNTPIINNSSKYFWNMIFLMILLVVSVVLNLLLIPRFGIYGAAIATVISSTMFNLLKFFFIWRNFKMMPYDLQTIKSVGVILFTGLVAWLLPVSTNPWFAIATRGTVIFVVYVSLTYVLKIVPEYNLVLKNWLQRNRKG